MADQWEMFEKLVGESAFLPDDNLATTSEVASADNNAVEEKQKSNSVKAGMILQNVCIDIISRI